MLDLDVEYIVNAANPMMRGGGGLDGVVHERAGPRLLEELRRVAPQGAAVGEVVLTSAHDLPFKGIIHVAGPRWRGGSSGEDDDLSRAYWNCLAGVAKAGGRSIGFCSISTGVFGFPIDRAAALALALVHSWIKENEMGVLERIVFALFRESEYLSFKSTNGRLDPNVSEF